MPRHHIKNGSLMVGGQLVSIMSGSINTSVEEVDVSDTGSGGWQEFLEGGGLSRAELSFEATWRDEAMPNSSPPGIIAGATLAFTLTLFTGKSFSGNIHITEVNYDLHDVGGGDAITYEVTGQSSGPMTLPT